MKFLRLDFFLIFLNPQVNLSYSKILTLLPATFSNSKSLSNVFQLQSGSWRHYPLLFEVKFPNGF